MVTVTSSRQIFAVASLFISVTLGLLGLGASLSVGNVYANSPTDFAYNATSAPTQSPQQSTFTPTPDPRQALDLRVSWESLVEAPDAVFTITVEMHDAEASSGDWVLGDVTGIVAEGNLSRGESERVVIDVDWSQRPFLNSPWWFYIVGQGDDGSSFAQVFAVNFSRPLTEGISPTSTSSCGYANFDMTTEADIYLAFPDETFEVGLANTGILNCGTVDWYLVENTLQPDALSCSPTNGVLEGSQPGAEANVTTIQCAINWDEIDSEQTGDLYLVLFSVPRVNGTDRGHLIRIHTTPANHD